MPGSRRNLIRYNSHQAGVLLNSHGSASKVPGSAELLYPAQLCISTSLCKKFSRLRNLPAPLFCLLNLFRIQLNLTLQFKCDRGLA